MNAEKITFSALVFVLIAGGFAPANLPERTEEEPELQIYLPREITVKDSSLTLGAVSIIRGDEELAAKANAVTLGQICVTGQKITIDRPTILSRLACSDVTVSKVTLTGAEKIIVKQHKDIIAGGDFIALARSFLNEKLAGRSVSELQPLRTPDGFAVPATAGGIEISAYLVGGAAAERARVRIEVLADGDKVAERYVDFRLKYNCRQAVAICDIAAGQVITPQNVTIEAAFCDRPEHPGWTAPYGSVAKRPLAADSVIQPNMLELPRPAVVIERNQNVLIKFEKPGLLVTAVGKALAKAAVGDYVKVRNLDSQRIILAKVNHDGTVEPVF